MAYKPLTNPVATDAVDAAFNKYLGRSAGASGKDYWLKNWEEEKQKAMSEGKGLAQAEAAATDATNKNISASQEAKVYADTNIARKAVEGTESFNTVDDTPDWYTAGTYTDDDINEFASGTRDENWATKLDSGNLAGFLSDQNYQYGTLQGNTVGQEGNEWWGYQKNLAIDHYMSDAGGNYSFDTARQLADANVAADIARNTGHENFVKYGSIGYGNTLDIQTAKEANVSAIPADEAFGIDQVYLNFDPRAMEALKGGLWGGTTDDAGNLVTTGSKKFEPYYIDDDGNVVTGDAIPDDYDGDLITDDPASKFRYVPNQKAPSGYMITADPALELSKVIQGESSSVGSDGTVVSGYMDDRGRKTFEIPTNVTNVDSSRFSLPDDDPNKLTLSQWVENPANKAAVEAGDFSYKNTGGGLVVKDGQVYGQGTGKRGGEDTNLGLKENETLSIVQDDGKTTNLTGGNIVTNPATNTSNTTNTTNNQIPEGASNIYYGSGGGGNKTIIATPPPTSKTAKMQQIKDPVRINAQAAKKSQYNKIRGRSPARIPGTSGSLNIPVG
tara:strand:- start:420 stop:2090 length:1671 start_codon:yes stop_codon:yes gene_type:complete